MSSFLGCIMTSSSIFFDGILRGFGKPAFLKHHQRLLRFQHLIQVLQLYYLQCTLYFEVYTHLSHVSCKGTCAVTEYRSWTWFSIQQKTCRSTMNFGARAEHFSSSKDSNELQRLLSSEVEPVHDEEY